MSNTRYTIIEKMAEGGLGTVYKAHDTNLDREVALKRVKPEILASGGTTAEDLVKEARVLSALQHPNIVTVYDVGTDTEGPFVVMELLVGETLDQTIKRSALTFDDFSIVVTQCLEGLIAAHAKDLVHRDLKPSNLMVIWHASGKFQIKILDFGLAKFGQQPSVQTADQEDGIMGSIYFMAPEQFERAELDARTDLYSLAANLYFSLTAQYPYQGDSAPQVMASHLQHRYTPLASLRPDLEPWVGKWIDWMMHRVKESRPASAKEALEHFRKKSFGTVKPAAAVDAQAAPAPVAPAPSGGINLNPGVPAAATATPAPTPAPAPTPVAVVTPAASQAPTQLLAAAKAQQAQEAAASPSSEAAVPAVGGSAPKLQAGGLKTSVGGGSTTGQLQAGNLPAAEPAAAAAGDEDGEDVLEALPAAEEEPKKSFFASIPVWAYISVPILLLLLGGLALKRSMKQSRLDAERAQTEALLNQEEPTGGPSEVAMLVEHLRNDPDGDQGIAAATVLSRMKGDGVDDAIAAALTTIEGTGKVNLMNAVAMRECEPAVPNLLLATESAESDVRRGAFNALGFTAGSGDVPVMIEKLDALEDDRDRDFAANAISSVCERIVNESSRSRAVIEGLSTVSEPRTKNALLKIIAQLGGSAAYGRVKALLTDPDRKLDAARALGEWQSSKPLPDLLEFIQKNEGTPERIVALQSMAMVASRPSPFPHRKTVEILSESFPLAPRSREKSSLLVALSQIPGEDSKAAITKLTEEDAFKAMRKQLFEMHEKGSAKIVKVDGETALKPGQGLLLGQGAALSDDLISSWSGLDSHVRWELEVSSPGEYTVSIEQSCDSEKPGVYRVVVAGESFGGNPEVTGDTFKEIKLGSANFKEAGNYNLWIVPIKITDTLFNVRSVKLSPK